jgi:hypothetical protein
LATEPALKLHTFVAGDGLPGATIHGMVDATRSWLTRISAATGFTSARSFVLRSLAGVVIETLVCRFVLLRSAALAFDLAVSMAFYAITLLLAYFMVKARSR